MELRSCFKRVARIIPLLLILVASARLVLLSLDQLGTPARVFDAELSIGTDAWKFKSRLESGCFCCSGAALIPKRTEALESFAASKPNDALKPRDLARHLLSTLQETQGSLSHSSSLPRHLTVTSQTYPLHSRNANLPDLPPSRRKVWYQGKGCAVVSYSEDRNASASHGENVWGVLTSDRGWDDEVQDQGKGKEAILIVALLDGEGGGLKSWGLGAGLMEWYARAGGPNSSPLERPLVFLFAQDTQGVKSFLEMYNSKTVRDPRSSDPYSYRGGPHGRSRNMAALFIDIPTLNTTAEGLEHYGSLTLRTAPLTKMKDQNAHLLSLASFVASIRSPVTPFLVDNGTSSASSSVLVNLVKSWSPVASKRIIDFSSLLSNLLPSSSSLESIFNRHRIPSLTLQLPRQLTTLDSPFSHSVYSISTLSQVLDSTVQALSKSDLPDGGRGDRLGDVDQRRRTWTWSWIACDDHWEEEEEWTEMGKMCAPAGWRSGGGGCLERDESSVVPHSLASRLRRRYHHPHRQFDPSTSPSLVRTSAPLAPFPPRSHPSTFSLSPSETKSASCTLSISISDPLVLCTRYVTSTSFALSERRRVRQLVFCLQGADERGVKKESN